MYEIIVISNNNNAYHLFELSGPDLYSTVVSVSSPHPFASALLNMFVVLK